MSDTLDKYRYKLKLLNENKVNKIKEDYKIKYNSPPVNSDPIDKPKVEHIKLKAENAYTALHGSRIYLDFKYNEEVIEKIRSIDGRKWDADGKFWSIPVSLININTLMDLGFEIDKETMAIMNRSIKKDSIKFDINNIKVPDGLSLMDFQNNTIKFIEEHNGKAVVALDQGLGKTIVVSTYINNHKEMKPIIIVVPATLKYNWKNELEKWVERKIDIQILEGKRAKKLRKTSDIIIINYDILSSWVKKIEEIKPALLVCDEAQYIKSRTSKRSKAVLKLAKKIPNVLPLSGTPATNRPAELYNVIHLVEPTLFSGFVQYAKRYCDPVFNGFGWEYKGASNMEELHSILSDFMIRYKKEEVLKELPEKQFTFIPLDLSNRAEYNRAENNFIEWVKENKGKRAAARASSAEKLVKMAALRHLATLGALPYSIQWIKDFLENTDEKLVVFANHKDIINALEEEFKDICVKIDGDTKRGETRQKLVDKFQNDEKIRLFIGNIVAAGVGLTLTAASNMVFLELDFSPGIMNQAMDRIHRISQKNACMIYYLLPTDTIEMTLAKLIDSKMKVLSKILDGITIKEEDTLTELMGVYENE